MGWLYTVWHFPGGSTIVELYLYYRVVGSVLMGTYVQVQYRTVQYTKSETIIIIRFFGGPKAFFNFCVYHISIGSTVSRTLAFGIWLSSLLASVGLACLITSSESGLPHWTWSVRLKSAPARTWTHDRTIGPCQAMTSLLICVVLSPRTWGYVEGGYQHW